MRINAILFLPLMVGLAGYAASATAPGDVPPANPAAPPEARQFPLTAFAAIGSSFIRSSHLPELGWTESQVEAFVDGVRASFHNKGYVFDETARSASAEMARQINELTSPKKQPAADGPVQSAKFAQSMKALRKRFSLQLSDTGLAYNIQPGRMGVRPRPGDTVVVTCVAKSADGTTTLPQLSNERVRVKLVDLLPGIMEGLQMMTIDSQAVLVLPPALSFGDAEWPEGVERGMPLVFFFTLHEVVSAEAAP